MPSLRALPFVALLLGTGCVLPEETFEDSAPAVRRAGVGETLVVDDRVGALQLHLRGEEATLPVIPLDGPQQLRLEFDLLRQSTGLPLDVSFVHTDRAGEVDLLPSEYLRGFESDRILNYDPSGSAADVPYVHYRYDFPNDVIGFKVSGNYRAIVKDTQGEVLFDVPFFVTEQLAEVDLVFGSTVQDGSVGFAVQPAARLRPDARLREYDGSQFTVCFGRNGRTDALRCAPEPSLVDLALYQFYLPRSAAFTEQQALFQFDTGFLGVNTEVVEVDRAASPPTALLDLDFSEFGGDVRQAVIASMPLISTAYSDIGRADVDAEYVEVTFRYVPPQSRQSARRVYVVGPFNGWRRAPDAEMEWVQAEGRYQATLLLKQGRYVYSYLGADAQTPGLSAASLFTAYVYLADPRRFTDRLIAVQSGIAQ